MDKNWTELRKSVNFTLTLAATAVIFTAYVKPYPSVEHRRSRTLHRLSIQLSFWNQMVQDLPMSYEELNISSAINSVGTAVGCVLFIPLSIKYGRRSTYLGSILLMLAMAIWSALARNKWDIYFTNLFFGMAGSTNETIVQMTVCCRLGRSETKD